MRPVLVSGLSKSLVRLTTIVALCGWAAVGNAASFPCEKARSKVEKAICADPELAQLDWYLGAYYEGARYALQDGADCLKTDQLHWLKAVRNGCADRSCLKAVYLARLSELDGFQPGASAIKDRELPVGPSLVWVIPPAGDTVVPGSSSDLRVQLRSHVWRGGRRVHPSSSYRAFIKGGWRVRS